MKQKGFTLIELLIVIGLLGIVIAVIIINNPAFLNIVDREATNETVVTNTTIFEDLASEPISSLNLTELEFMLDYCMEHHSHTLANLYQNQIIINELKEQ